jgi:Predicted exonuclease of the beta-lactamase fold involved in RNA processing
MSSWTTTYGNRLHPENSGDIEKLIEIIVKTAKRGGIVVIPSFAVGRTQELIYQFNRFYEENNKYRDELEKLNVYVDSPMATTATEVFRRNADVFDEETKAYIMKGDNPLDFKNLKFTRTTEESQALNFDRQPKIIISASGMDYEYQKNGRLTTSKPSTAVKTKAVNAFFGVIEDAGYTPMLYASRDFLINSLNAEDIDSSGEIWLAQWASSTSYSGPFSFWQWTSKGKIPGFSDDKNFDMVVKIDKGIVEVMFDTAGKKKLAVDVAPLTKVK